MSTTATVLLARGGHGDYALFQWLWHRFHWWGVPVFSAFVGVTGLVQAFFGRGSDD